MPEHYIDRLMGEREKILLVTRQHWFILASSIFLEVTLILILLAATTTLALIFLKEFSVLTVAVGFILLLIPVGSMIHDILEWSNRQYIVTNRRVIQIAGIINKSITDSSLEKVNDVKMSQSILGRVFDFGDIEIMTASELGINLFKRIGDPIHFKTAMINAKAKLEGLVDHPPFGEEPHRSDIPALIERLDQLRKQGTISEEEFQRKKSELLSKL